jgi:2',3'-cyclic-nucleotide 2'-phosphodiesterase (5'-nucleotidase family)
MRLRMLTGLAIWLQLAVGEGLYPQEINILFTNSANGVIQNCYCPDTHYGGLEKRAFFIEEYRKQNTNVLVIDNGDNFIEYMNPGFEQVITETMKMLDYDVINLGDQDVAYAYEEYFELGAVVKNLGEDIKLRKGDIKYSILPLLHPGTTRFYPDFIFIGYGIEDYREQIETWLNRAYVRDSFKILLSHSGLDQDKELAAAYPEIDLIVGGHSQTVVDTPLVVAGVPIVQAGGYAGFVGEIHFSKTPSGYNVSSYQLHTLSPEAPDHPDVLKLIDQHVSNH